VRLEDPDYLTNARYVRDQYESEKGLAARASLYAETAGPFAGDLAFDAVAETGPRRFLEVGCGTGWFAARVQRELGAEVIAIDQSERMVELAREQGLDARAGDVQQLEFDDGEFDCVAANWMLFHVPDLDRGLTEIARVLRSAGRLIAITNGKDHLLELWQIVGVGGARLGREFSFGSENGGPLLRRYFQDVELRDASGTVTISSRDAVIRFLGSMEAWKHLVARVPADVRVPFSARRSTVVFVADKAAA
jgi:SAM-dependent methyltransferase